MIIDDQQDIIAFLSNPETWGGDPVERIETHISLIFLAGERAYKLKRAVRFAYLDFSTPQFRQAACEAEVSINRLTAPTIYRRVVAITRSADGSLSLDGDGEPVDWLVEMTRFGQEEIFDHLAREGRLDRRLMEDLAGEISRFHEGAEVNSRHGGHDGMSSIIEGNTKTFAEVGPGILDMDKVALFDTEARRLLDLTRALLDRRRETGSVRRCHGDLHLRNIVLLDGHPTLFDAIEFNSSLSHIDVLYDLAFLLMDLEHQNLKPLANVVLNRYQDMRDDNEGLAVLPLFMSVRASIRSHVAAASVVGISPSADSGTLAADARSYLDMALDYLSPPRPRLIAVGGLSGSGKSRLARELAPFLGMAAGARVVRSDVTRKKLAGVDPLTRLGQDGYSTEMTERTYRAVYDQSRAALSAGHSVIADAVFSRPDERRAIAGVASEAGVPFQGLWLEAPLEIMRERVSSRKRNASDADLEVVRRQGDYDLGTIDWDRIDSSGAREETVARGRTLIGR